MKLKGIDGGPHKQWSMWFNSTQREEPYQVLTSCDAHRNMCFLRDAETGGAWLSSARVVRCWVKSRNERNPYGQLLRKRTLARLPLTKRRKVGMTSNHHALYDLGYTRTTMALNKEKQDREVEQNSETTSPVRTAGCNSPARSPELLVIVDQHATVNTFPGLVHTARHTMRAGGTRSR